MTPRSRGDYFERQTKAALESFGWFVVRAGGSLGIADLVALRDGKTPLLVSCKVGGQIGPDERRELAVTALAAGGRAILASRPRRGWIALHAVKTDQMPVALEEIEAPKRHAHEGGDDDG